MNPGSILADGCGAVNAPPGCVPRGTAGETDYSGRRKDSSSRVNASCSAGAASGVPSQATS